MANNNRNVSGLLKSAKEKNKITFLHVERTLKQMIDEQQTITFSHVAKQAQVSRSWLYKDAIIRNKIETIRQEQSKKIPSGGTLRLQHSHSQDKVVEHWKDRARRLRQENAKLHKQLEVIYGKMAEE